MPRNHIQYQKYLSRVGNRVRQERKEQNISQSQLAFEISSTIRQIQRIEKGDINAGITYYIAICEVLDIQFIRLGEILDLPKD
ncbi:MAG: helix-turn-helix transcriptional regulator [Crocinitomicaceae bacterium]|nr:helix-turn-helix domain-containing protein [Flavobacteriales bacterium]NQZ37069.1 helix-turn-helix transcriptional regulator [Crocinitomicaceae bacterium]